MTETLQQIQAAVMNGLTRPEIEGLLGRKLEEDEVQEFNKIKALLKLKERQEEIDKKQREAAAVPAAPARHTYQCLPPVQKRYAREEVAECIERHYGIMTSICRDLDCTYKQLYSAIKHYDLEASIDEARKNIVSKAESVLLDALSSTDEKTRIDAAKYTLERLGKTIGWSTNPNVAMTIQVSPGEKEAQIKAIFGIQPQPTQEAPDSSQNTIDAEVQEQ